MCLLQDTLYYHGFNTLCPHSSRVLKILLFVNKYFFRAKMILVRNFPRGNHSNDNYPMAQTYLVQTLQLNHLKQYGWGTQD